MLGGDAGPYRHLDRLQLAQDQTGSESGELSPKEILATRAAPDGLGMDASKMSDEDIQKISPNARANSATRRR